MRRFSISAAGSMLFGSATPSESGRNPRARSLSSFGNWIAGLFAYRGTPADTEPAPDERLHFERLISELSSANQRASQALLESERLNRRILESLREQVAVLDRNGVIVAVNDAWERFAGDHGAEKATRAAVGVNYLEVCRRASAVGSAAASEALSGIQAVLNGDRTEFELEYSCDAPSRRLWFLMTVSPVNAADGGAIIIHRDNTKRRQAEDALRAEQQRYHAVLEAQTELVCRYLPDTTLTFVNAAYCRFFGRSREQLIGQRFVELIPERAREFALSHVAAMVRDARTLTSEHEVNLPDGSIGWQQWIDTPVLDQDGKVAELQAIGRDVTERKRVEDGLRRLTHASRLAVVGQLAASIAHEVNQPLGAIRSNADAAEMLLDSGVLNQTELCQILADIRRDAQRASNVVQNVRSLLRKSELRLEPLDLRDLGAEVVRLVKSEAQRRKVSLTLALPECYLHVKADRVGLEQVLMNLIINAIEAMADQPETKLQILVTGFTTDDGEAAMAVTDAGPGFAPEVLPKVFDSFFTTKSDGMGLGLSLARTLVQAHGGRIWAENNSRGGATVSFALPSRADQPEGSAEMAVLAADRSTNLHD